MHLKSHHNHYCTILIQLYMQNHACHGVFTTLIVVSLLDNKGLNVQSFHQSQLKTNAESIGSTECAPLGKKMFYLGIAFLRFLETF